MTLHEKLVEKIAELEERKKKFSDSNRYVFQHELDTAYGRQIELEDVIAELKELLK
jgi:hypothetical protein